MSEEIPDKTDNQSTSSGAVPPVDSGESGGMIALSGMYKDWFLDYASYVILERAVPALMDGLKPVQRRLLHAMKEMDDGRYNKVANIIGSTMKYHPHGDASIGDALVQMGQKDLLIDTQGNWGNTLTGDSAAAARYIEARLSKFASHVVFNPKTTEWVASYDGRNQEPINLPVKFPLLLEQGAEGIAVGMACKILPHNFNELIDASVDVLRGKRVDIQPDFPGGGLADVTGYNEGVRGGKVRLRARIEKVDNKTLKITEIPYGTTTSSLIETILKANEKAKIKIRHIEDNTAENVEINIHLAAGVSPDKTIDALYAFTSCEMSVSPNTSVIVDNKPMFLSVNEMLKISTQHTLDLLKKELQIRQAELEESWHFASLEKLFIEKRVYVEFDGKTYEQAIELTHKKLKPYLKKLRRPITDDDVKKLLELRMRRITKHDAEKADTFIESLETELALVKKNLKNLVEYAIEYFKDLKKRFGVGRERKSEIRVFDNIDTAKVIVANRKLYIDKEEGFIGWGLRGGEPIAECSEIDDVILFFLDGRMMVTRIADKKFVGKDIIYAGIWKKGDERTIYHLVYRDGGEGRPTMMKRFAVSAITRDKEYFVTRDSKGTKIYYFSFHPNGESELLNIQLRPKAHIRRLKFDLDFGKLLIKGRDSMGNLVTREAVARVVQKEVGESTLAARKIWWDEVVKRLNVDDRGRFLGDFQADDRLLTLYANGDLRLSNYDLSIRFDDDLIHIEKWFPNHPVSCIYWDAEKELFFVKRFYIEVKSDKRTSFISESQGSSLAVVSTAQNPVARLVFNKRLKETKDLNDKILRLAELIEVKGMKVQGNQVTRLKVKEILLEHPIEGAEPWPEEEPLPLPEAPESAATMDLVDQMEQAEKGSRKTTSSKTSGNKDLKSDIKSIESKKLKQVNKVSKTKKPRKSGRSGGNQPTLF